MVTNAVLKSLKAIIDVVVHGTRAERLLNTMIEEFCLVAVPEVRKAIERTERAMPKRDLITDWRISERRHGMSDRNEQKGQTDRYAPNSAMQ